MNNSKKKIIILSIIGIIVLSIGIAYAARLYTNMGSNNQLIAGDMYMHYLEGTEITIQNALPSDTYDPNSYFEFTIEGKNTSKTKDVAYEVVLTRGSVPNGKLEANRLADSAVKFRLTERIDSGNEEVVVDNRSFSDMSSGQRLFDEVIPKNQNTQTTRTYKLYFWIDGDILIGKQGIPDIDYTEEEWALSFASFKVNVNGDFAEKDSQKSFNKRIRTDTLDTDIIFYNYSGENNGQGLYKMASTAGDPYPIYYYRGNVSNNNVLFAGYCWKIVRTTDTGGLKLIFNGAYATVDNKKQCNNTTGAATVLQSAKYHTSNNSVAYVGYSLPDSSHIYTGTSEALSSGVYYGSSVNATTHKLEGAQTTLDAYHHYSYNSTDINATGVGATDDVRYYYYTDSGGTTGYYLTFSNTKSIATVLDEMLSGSTSKNNPSNIQTLVNTWWAPLDATYGKYLEDTVWCNDRTIGSLGGFNPNGGLLYDSKDINYQLFFVPRVRIDSNNFRNNNINIRNTNTPILTCSNPNDRLTVAGGNLTYPIGLLTNDEVAMAGTTYRGNNTNYYLYNGHAFYTMSPSVYGANAGMGTVYNGAYLDTWGVSSWSTLRPALSLKAGTQILGGDGTSADPYVITE